MTYESFILKNRSLSGVSRSMVTNTQVSYIAMSSFSTSVLTFHFRFIPFEQIATWSLSFFSVAKCVTFLRMLCFFFLGRAVCSYHGCLPSSIRSTNYGWKFHDWGSVPLKHNMGSSKQHTKCVSYKVQVVTTFMCAGSKCKILYSFEVFLQSLKPAGCKKCPYAFKTTGYILIKLGTVR